MGNVNTVIFTPDDINVLKVNKLVWNLSEYIEQNIPDFKFEDGKISMDINDPIIIDNFEYKGIEKVVVNTLADTDETKEQSEKDEIVAGITIFFFKDEIVLKSKIDDDNIQTQSYTYTDFIANYTKEDITTFNKNELIDYMRSNKIMPFYASYAVTMFIGLFITGMVYALLDTLRVAIFGWVTAVVAKIKMKFVAIYNMAVYSFTLPMILEIIYLVINYFTDFTIKYFQVALAVRDEKVLERKLKTLQKHIIVMGNINRSSRRDISNKCICSSNRTITDAADYTVWSF